MAKVSQLPDVCESEIRAAIVAKLETITGVNKVYGRERYADTLEDWLKIVGETANNKKRANVIFVEFKGFESSDEESAICGAVGDYKYEVSFIFGFDDRDNSNDVFNSIVMRSVFALVADVHLGYENLELIEDTLESDASVEPIDKSLNHTTSYFFIYKVGNRS